ncbi:Vta1 like-domain-containing protein [Radiomyces spectabilis]|uniref:Vta1 like-domain-containing protein n=1 Tax=Radiomyces spectabilis TaxID=64574 RepID=UPI00221FCE95|nr:Vta1 like-domain-containing protein [Radiomyces spectabilis]KAI8374751.1 Vta1 like-domain-containing protein [Radiomyces spectabilis]
MDIPSELKYIAPYVQRGQELQEREPVVAYYAQYYAAKLAIGTGPRSPSTNAYLSHLLDTLEQRKQDLGANNEAITDDLVGYAHVENFALKVFLNADNEDRAGKASKKTAKTFLAASIFLELLKCFGDLDAETKAKIKYAKWKATDIMKALREGRTPTPGPPGGMEDPEQPSGSPTEAMQEDTVHDNLNAPAFPPPPPSISDFPSPPSNFTAPLPSHSPASSQAPFSPAVPPPNNNVSPPPPPTPQVSVTPIPPPNPAPPSTTFHPDTAQAAALPPMADPAAIAAAQKHAKWAISALNYDDIKTARLQLLTALSDLGYNQDNNFGF